MVLRHVSLGRPLLCFPSDAHASAILAFLSNTFLKHGVPIITICCYYCVVHVLYSENGTKIKNNLLLIDFLDKLIGAITHQVSSTGLPYSCILTAAGPNEVRVQIMLFTFCWRCSSAMDAGFQLRWLNTVYQSLEYLSFILLWRPNCCSWQAGCKIRNCVCNFCMSPLKTILCYPGNPANINQPKKLNSTRFQKIQSFHFFHCLCTTKFKKIWHFNIEVLKF